MRTGIFSTFILALAIGGWNCSFSIAQQPYPNTGEAGYPQTAHPGAMPAGQLPVPVALTPGQPPAAGQPITAGQPVAQPGAPAPQQFVGPPFQLTDVEQQYVDQLLEQWENRGAEIKTFDCQFEKWEYDNVFGPRSKDGQALNEPMRKCKGRLTYSNPDKGSFKIEEIYRFTEKTEGQPAAYDLQENEVGDHWVCDGKAIFQYNHTEKRLEVQKLPEDMRGADIVNGPLPFLFGAEAEKLKARYWIRSKKSDATTIWLEAYPRTQADAANYHHVEVMLERQTMLPKALQVHQPNGANRDVYIFEPATINGTMDKLFGGLFNAPRTPFGWKKVVMEAPVDPVGPQAANPQSPTQQR